MLPAGAFVRFFLPLLTAFAVLIVPLHVFSTTITAPSGNVCVSTSYTALGDIVVDENNKCDFSSGQSNVTYILVVPSGFEFNPGVGNVTCNGGDLTCGSITITSTLITVTLTTDNNCNGGQGNFDDFTISGIQYKATSSGSGDITFSSSSTMSVSGVSAGTVHGSLIGSGGTTPVIATASGNWSDPGIWNGGFAPTSCDSIEIPSTYTVTVNASSYSCRSLLIESGGTLISDYALTITDNFVVESGGTYEHNNSTVASSTIFAGTEQFDGNSNLIISSWSSWSTPLPTGFSGTFGNVTIPSSQTGFVLYEWDQNNMFETNPIIGKLHLGSVSANTSAWITLDRSASITNTTMGNLELENLSRFYGHYGAHPGSYIMNFDTIDMGGYRFFGLYIGNADVTIVVNGDLNLTNGRFFGTYNGTGDITLTVSGDLNMNTNDYVFVNYWSKGETNLTVNGTFTQTTGDFRGSYYLTTLDCGDVNFTIGTFDYTSGVFDVSYSRHIGDTIRFNVTNDMNVNFASSGNNFKFIGLGQSSGFNTTSFMDFDVGGDLTISGNTLAKFKPNVGFGDMDFNVGGDLKISGGWVRLNQSDVPGAEYTVTLNVGDSVIVSGGTTFFSEKAGLLTGTIGSFTQSGGTFSIKGDDGIADLNVNGKFAQTGGTFYFHNNSSNPTADTITMVVTDDFSQTAGTINFDNESSGSAEHVLKLEGDNYDVGTSGTMTHAGAGTATSFGRLYFQRSGTITFDRSGSHDIQQVKQYVKGGCTLDATNSIQVASHSTAATDYFSIENTAVVNMGTYSLYSNGTSTNSGVEVLSGAELRTKNTDGLAGTSSACINSSNAMDYYLGDSSIVEYYGDDNQILSGLGGIYTTNDHKYSILEIDFNGTASTEYVYPTSSNVYIRKTLDLIDGELNLDTDHTPANGGGSTVTIENPTFAALQRTNGYLRSEVEDNSGMLKWYLASVSGSVDIPFGYDAVDYIPVTVNLTAGSPDTLSTATYGTACENNPLPASPVNVGDLDLSGNPLYEESYTADRYWYVNSTASPTATLTFVATNTELSSISGLKSYSWDSTNANWDSLGGTTNTDGATITGVSSLGQFIISSGVGGVCGILPVELISFEANEVEKEVELNWLVASEEGIASYIIQRSSNGISFENWTHVEPLGWSYYQHYDKLPLPGESFYRLKMVDPDGSYEYSKIDKVQFGYAAITVHPNPATHTLMINGPYKYDQAVISNALGTRVLTSSYADELDVSHLTPGVYLLQLTTGEVVANIKFVKQ